MLRLAVLAAALIAVLVAGSAAAAEDPTPAAGTAAEPAEGAAVTPVADRWVWPVGAPGPPLRPFSAPATPYSSGHRGVDLASAAGAPVRSPADGVVSFAGVVVDRPVLSIQHADDLVSSFEPLTATVGVGDRVRAGQVVGTVGVGAHCSGRCVHLGVRRHGHYVSPLLFFDGVARAVLLPLPAAAGAEAPAGPAAAAAPVRAQARGWASR
jgi:murein DD-endopeptidase MepM/ murein hydrolase activator NlpD